jgi:hypothetical protein
MRRRGKAVAITAVVLGLGVLVGAGMAAKDRIVEEWWIYKLKTGDEEENKVAAETLADMRSVRAATPLVNCLREALLAAGRPRESDLFSLEPFRKIGRPALPALLTSGRPPWSFALSDGRKRSTVCVTSQHQAGRPVLARAAFGFSSSTLASVRPTIVHE